MLLVSDHILVELPIKVEIYSKYSMFAFNFLEFRNGNVVACLSFVWGFNHYFILVLPVSIIKY